MPLICLHPQEQLLLKALSLQVVRQYYSRKWDISVRPAGFLWLWDEQNTFWRSNMKVRVQLITLYKIAPQIWQRGNHTLMYQPPKCPTRLHLPRVPCSSVAVAKGDWQSTSCTCWLHVEDWWAEGDLGKDRGWTCLSQDWLTSWPLTLHKHKNTHMCKYSHSEWSCVFYRSRCTRMKTLRFLADVDCLSCSPSQISNSLTPPPPP